MPRHLNVSFAIACDRRLSRSVSFLIMLRSNLFREQVARFRRCEYRKPNISELRRIWRGTGFPTLER